MADLSPLDMQLVTVLFETDAGYVLDFSNSTFTEFFQYHGKVDIYAPQYAVRGGSKGKRLRYFLVVSSNAQAAATLSALWEYRLANRRGVFAAVSADDFLGLDALVKRLGGRPLAQPAKASSKPSTQDAVAESSYVQLQNELASMRPMDAQTRGYAFEKFLTQAFETFGLTPRQPFRNRGEQIDGSFQLDESTYLLEAKWTGPRTAADDLHIFCGKITQKASWSRGLFVSESGYSAEGLEAFGRGKPIICMDGLDLHDLLRRRIPLDQVLRLKARRAAETGSVYISVGTLFP